MSITSEKREIMLSRVSVQFHKRGKRLRQEKRNERNEKKNKKKKRTEIEKEKVKGENKKRRKKSGAVSRRGNLPPLPAGCASIISWFR